MDRLDVAIIRELTQAGLVLPARPGVAPSNREISRKLGVPPGTVRYRIKRMYRAGVINGSSVFPNPNLIGTKEGAFTVDVSPLLHKPEVIRKMKQMDGVSFIHDFVGSLLWAVFVYEDEMALSSKLEQLRELAGAEGTFSRVPFPPCRAPLTRPEVSLVLDISVHGMDSYGAMAERLGISVRTLQRRLSKLVRAAAIVSVPRVEYKAIRGSVPADLVVLFSDLESATKSQREILSMVGDSVILAALWDRIGMCSLVLPDVAGVTALVETVKQVEGVVTARVEIVKDHIDQSMRLDAYTENWLKQRGMKAAPIRVETP